ncbi:MAG: hypothetical protein A4S09_02050 [Proteobacteria bacterium SG_bin7]|nr:MAG: hypothetical protein A4S09_02050 [Proteobacteria bacterium SG_bin7]
MEVKIRATTKKLWITFVIFLVAGVIGTHYWLSTVVRTKEEVKILNEFKKGEIGIFDIIKHEN